MATQSIELDLSTVVPSLSGPKRPHDRVALSEMKEDFQKCLDNKVNNCHGYHYMSYTVCVQNFKERNFRGQLKFKDSKIFVIFYF